MPGQHHIILIVDDDKLILNTLQQRFSSFKNEVYTASTPEQAREIVDKLTPDLVILDLLLTKADGSTGIIDHMKSEPRLVDVPIIALTNLDKPELKEFILEQGVKEYLIKGNTPLDEVYNKAMGYLEPQNKNPETKNQEPTKN